MAYWPQADAATVKPVTRTTQPSLDLDRMFIPSSKKRRLS
jgi:hypothetical protein